MWFAVGSVGPHRDEGSESPSFDEIVELLRRSDVFTLVLAGTMYLFATHSIYGWLSPLLILRGLGTDGATQIVAVITLGMVIGSLAVPYLADRTSKHAVCVGGGLAFGASVVGLAVITPQFWPLATTAFVGGIAIGGISPLLRKLPLDMVPSGVISTVVGMVFGLGAIGGFVGPVVIGTAQEWTNTSSVGFAILALSGVAFAGVALRLSQE